MLELLGEANATALIGLIGGCALGLAARMGRFCTLGAIEDCLYSTDDRRLRMWGVAIATAIIGVQFASLAGLFDPTETAYLTRAWTPFATVIGGLMFGYGMALSGNCGYGALARLGGGDLRALVIVIVMGLSGYFVMSGPLAHARVWLFPVDTDAATPQAISTLLETRLNWKPAVTGLLIGTCLLALSLASQSMRQSPKFIFWGVVVGLAVVSGWIGTYLVALNGFEAEPIETHTFVAPIGDTIFYSMTASGNALSFSVGSVMGVILGAWIGAVVQGHFLWEACEDARELKRQMMGACLMGVGAILAFGCSVGQGISAFSVLAYSAPVALISIYIGAAVGLRQLIAGFAPAE